MYSLLNFGWKPTTFLELPRKEKAAVIAMIDFEAKDRAEKQREIERKGAGK